ncbi:MAG TPA: efflux RND transporter periplasmic adaptor subunit [Rhizomicrobium sp.]|nr:efflux RND transporter periplasmic adaptor subunit [Rhizomicrobium sp.]
MSDQAKLIGIVAVVGLLGLFSGYAVFRFSHEEPVATDSKNEEQKAGKNTIALSEEQIKSADIGVQQVSIGAIGAEVLAQAIVVPSPTGAASLTAHASGTVTRIFKRIGEPVKAGDVLAVVEGRDAAQIAADRSAANARAVLAAQNLAREKSLFEQGITPRAAYEQAQAEAAAATAEGQRAQTAASSAHVTSDGRGVAVTSPIDGAVTASNVRLGAFVQSETELFQVSARNSTQVEASITSEDISRISVGDKAIIELPGRETIEGEVRSITPNLNATTRAATAVIEARGMALRSGQIVRVRIVPRGETQGSGMTVPDDAIQMVEGRPVIFVRTTEGFVARPVLTGRPGAGRTEILRGLRTGERIATRNAFVLKSEISKGAGEEE